MPGSYGTDSSDPVAALKRTVDELRSRLSGLERAKPYPPKYTTAARPTASDVPGLVIYNTTTSKHQGSNGATWNDLF